MVSERENFEIFVRLLGLPEMTAQARAAAESIISAFSGRLNDDVAFGGGDLLNLKGQEVQLAAFLSKAQDRVSKARSELARVLKDPLAREATEVLERRIPLNRRGELNQNAIRSQTADFNRVRARADFEVEEGQQNVVERLLAARAELADATGRSAGIQGKLNSVIDKRAKAEFEASEEGQAAAATAKLEAQRRRGLASQVERETKEREAAEAAVKAAAQKEIKERGAATASLERQRSRALSREAELEHNAQRNPLTGTLEDYTTPSSFGLHEPGRSQYAVAKADEELAAAKRKVELVYNKAAAGQLTDTEATAAMSTAKRQLNAAFRRQLEATDRLNAEQGGFAAQFRRGFKGASDIPYAQQLGQAVKFSAFYGAAYRIQFALLQTFRDALTQGIDFQQGLSDMAVATGRSKEELGSLSESLAQIASDAGTSPSAGLAIGARAIGLYGLAGSSDAQQQAYVTQLSTAVVSKLALGSKVDPVTLQQNLAAITQATGLGPGGQIRVADLDAYFSKRFGTAPGDTLESGAQSASVGIAAGFSLEEVQALAALMISRTGQTPSAVGGYLAQIFSRGGEGSLSGVAQKFGIETNGRTLAAVFEDLAKRYKESGAQAQAEISAAFGRGKVQNAVVTALQDFDEVKNQARLAKGGAADGSLDRAFNQRVNNIGGEIAILSGHFKEFAHLFGESGLLSSIGLVVVLFDKLLTSTNSVLLGFNSLPGPLRTLVGLLVASAAAQRFGLVGAIASRVGPIYRGGAAAGAIGSFEAAELGGAAAIGSTGLRAVGFAALKSLAPFAAATAGLVAVGYLANAARKVNQAADQTVSAIKQAPGYNASPDELRNYASQLTAQAKIDADTGNGFKKFLTGEDLDASAAALSAEAKRNRDLAAQIEKNAPVVPTPIFTNFDTESFSAGFDAITREGGTAVTQLHALGQAIDGLSERAAVAVDTIDTGRLAGPLAASLASLSAVTGGSRYVGGGRAGGGSVPYNLSGKSLSKEVTKQLPADEIQDILDKQLQGLGVTRFSELSPEQQQQVAHAVANSLTTGGGIDVATLEAARDQVYSAILDGLIQAGGVALEAITGKTNITGAEAQAALDSLSQRTADAIASLAETDYSGRTKKAEYGLRRALQTFRNTDAQGQKRPAVIALVQRARDQFAETAINQQEALRAAAVAGAKTDAEAARRADPFIRKEIRIAVRQGSRDQLARVIASAGPGYRRVAQAEIDNAKHLADSAQDKAQAELAAAKRLRAALDAAAAAYRSALDVLDLIPSILGGAQDLIPGTVLTPKPKKPKTDTGGLQESLDTTASDYGSGASAEDAETAAERRAARLAAEAARKGGDIAAARAAIAQARAELDKAKKGTVAYYNALASYYQAQDQLNEAFRNYRHILRELKIDTTDPVAEANLALQEARRKLRQDIRRHKARDVTAQDKLDVKNAQNEAEAAKFDQRLSDVQTAEELGKISHAAYIRYLESEHNRLQSIAHRTRQQQDELNQIDKLLKDAQGELQGQFNIGDIKLPTPYEVRRYIKSQVVSTPYALNQANGGTTTIYINGADTGVVKRIIDETVGRGTRVLTTTTRRT